MCSTAVVFKYDQKLRLCDIYCRCRDTTNPNLRFASFHLFEFLEGDIYGKGYVGGIPGPLTVEFVKV